MSVFDDIPYPFPLKIKVDRRPVEFELRRDSSDKLVDIIMPVIWGSLIIAFAFYIISQLDPAKDQNSRLFGLAVMVIAGVYFGRKVVQAINNNRIKTMVRITDDLVDITVTGGKNPGNWSAPLDEYEGVAIDDRGIHDINGKKRPIVALLLQHQKNSLSVPIHITTADNLGKKKVNKIARQLNLPVVPYVHSNLLDTNMPEGTIVANVYQNTKLKLVYYLVAAASLALMATGVYVFLYWGLAPADGGVLKPFYQRLAFAGVLAALAAAAFYGIHYYRTCYVIGLQRIGDKLRLHTSILPSGQVREFSIGDVEKIAEYQGQTLNSSDPDTNHSGNARLQTPYALMSVKGYPRRFLIDLQGEFVNQTELIKLKAGQKP